MAASCVDPFGRLKSGSFGRGSLSCDGVGKNQKWGVCRNSLYGAAWGVGMLRLRGDDRFAIIAASLSMTVVNGAVPSAAEAEIILGADGTLRLRSGQALEAVPFPISAGRWRISWRRVA